MAAAAQPTFEQLMRQVKGGAEGLAPIYIVHGEEGFYADRLVEAFMSLIPEADRDFDLQVLYGPSTTPAEVYTASRRFPMMSPRQVVILKEAQAINAKDVDKLAQTVSAPAPQTVLLIVFRGAKAKGREFLAAARKGGAVIFESKKVRENQVGGILASLIKERGLNIEPKGLAMLTEHLGADLSRLYNEVDKLAVALPAGALITPETVQLHIGINKDYNNFEFIDAVAQRDTRKAYSIIKHFAAHPKENPWPMLLTMLYNFFSDVIIYQFARDKSAEALSAELGTSNSWTIKRCAAAARLYNAYQTIEIMSAIRRTDVNAKGMGSRLDAYVLMEDLLFYIFSAQGRLPV